MKEVELEFTIKIGGEKTKGKERYKCYEMDESGDTMVWHTGTGLVNSWLLHHKPSGTFRAWTSEVSMLFPSLAKAPYASPDDSPVDHRNRPKFDVLLMLAVRDRIGEYAPDRWSHFLASRIGAVSTYIREFEDRNPLDSRDWGEFREIANSKERFEEWAGRYLVDLLKSDDAGDKLVRLGNWLKKVQHIEAGEFSQHYLRFFEAVETAAERIGGLPTQKEVRVIYEEGQSANQLGRGHGFRSVMKQLRFEWLPAGTRGAKGKR